MTIATNPQTNETVFLNPQGQWEPAKTAVDPSGAKVAFDGTEWVPIQAQPQAPQAQVAPQPAQAPPEEGGLLEDVLGGAEVFGTVASGIIAEPIAGIAGLAKSITSGPEEATRTIEGIRQALTFQPRTEAGQGQLAAVGEALEPVAKVFTGAEKALGDTAFKLTGSPAIAAAAASIPTIILELPALRGLKAVSKPKKISKAAREAVIEAAPTPEVIKASARTFYKEIDDLGAVVKVDAMDNLLNQLRRNTAEVNINRFTTPQAFGMLQDFDDSFRGQNITLSALRNAEGKAKTLLASKETAEQAVGIAIVNTIDDFMDAAGPKVIDFGANKPKEIGTTLRAANDLWRRARSGEEIQDIFAVAELADNADLAIKNGFKKLLLDKKKSRFFSAEDREAMRAVVKGKRGTPGFRLLDFLGKAGIDGTSYFRAGLMGTLAGMVAGPGAASALVAGSTISKELAKRLRRGNAAFADAVIRSGKDADKVMQAYIKHTPKAQRSAAEMAELLAKPSIDIERSLLSSDFANTAKELALRKRNAIIPAVAGAGASGVDRSALE